MAIFKCKMCGGTLEIHENEHVTICEYCGTKQTIPKLDNEKRANLYDRANHFRRNDEFDKAMNIYNQILNEDPEDAEAYWCVVLCRYGIEYVEDPATHKQMPTINRMQFMSVLTDEDYKSALQYADFSQREIYETEAKAIDRIQKDILEISSKEEPFDIFICYKEADQNGRRTYDSVLANDLYHELTEEGYNVFFSRITLEDKIGLAYEPYIFAALNSAKIMVVLGTRQEYFNAVWVKNEWSRFLALIKNGANKILIPAYKDMNPYDLPEEFSHLQAQDMGKLGFMQDLIRGIKKIVTIDEENSAKSIVMNSGTNIEPLLKRTFMFLEDKEWDKATEYCERVLDQDPENVRAYLGKLMAEMHVTKQENLANCKQPFNKNNNYKKVLRFADEKLTASMKGYIDFINDRNEKERINSTYHNAVGLMKKSTSEQDYKRAAEVFQSISGYKDAALLSESCLESAKNVQKDHVYKKAIENIFKFNPTIQDYEESIRQFESLGEWKDSAGKIKYCNQKIEEIKLQEEKYHLEQEHLKQETKQSEIKSKIVVWLAVLCCASALIWLIYFF